MEATHVIRQGNNESFYGPENDYNFLACMKL